MTSEIALKPYPCCHFTHAFIDAALELRAQGVRPEEIERVECPVTERLMPQVTEPAAHKTAPRTIYDALFSVQYAVALALVRGRVDLATFYDEPLDDPDVLAIAARVTCPPDPESDYPQHFPGEVILHLTDGRTLRRRIPASLGTPERPLSATELRKKFHANAGRELSAARTQLVVDAVDRIEDLQDVGELMSKCVNVRDDSPSYPKER